MTKKVSGSTYSGTIAPGDNLNYSQDYTYVEGTHKASQIGKMYYQYDGNGNLLAQQYGSPVAVSGSNAVVNEKRNENYAQEYEREYYYHGDHLGSAQVVTDSAGSLYERCL